jgi:hypothetical protein
MATSVSARTLAEIADAIASKRRLYRSAFASDLSALRARHGETAIAEALQLAERNNVQRDASRWDAPGHAVEVRQAVDRLFHRKDQIKLGRARS